MKINKPVAGSATLIVVSLFFFSCRAPDRVERRPDAEPTPLTMEQVTEKLGMNLPREQVGFMEKKFSSCEVGYAADSSCPWKFLTVVQFRIQCRDTMGTVSEVPTQLTVLRNKVIAWYLDPQNNGSLKTDEQGYARWSLISEESIGQKSLRLTFNGKNLLKTVADFDVRFGTLPQDYCVSKSP